jgi:hypothetical protein
MRHVRRPMALTDSGRRVFRIGGKSLNGLYVDPRKVLHPHGHVVAHIGQPVAGTR